MSAEHHDMQHNDLGSFSGLEPGQRVRHPDRPDWGDGQIQSIVGSRVTVNFEHVGKILINARVISLSPIE